jgi:protein SCO1/2
MAVIHDPKLRRRLILALGAAALLRPERSQSHAAFGPVRPEQAAPPLKLTGMDGKASDFAASLKGRVTALQLIFTGCSATCPIQGAVFAQTQTLLAASDKGRGIHLLSVSIDPLGDDVKALREWLARHGAQPQRWTAALPTMQQVDPMLDFLRGRATGPDRHTAQAFVFDRQARLVHRTENMPAPQALASLLLSVAARG